MAENQLFKLAWRVIYQLGILREASRDSNVDLGVMTNGMR